MFFFKNNKLKKKPVVLVVLDGFGIAPDSPGNAITRAKTPKLNYFRENYINTSLIASGESVGLPANEVGNTEVGHLTMGAGRVILQDLKRINEDIEKGRFFDNKALIKAGAHVKENGSNMHIMGLIGSGNVHSSLSHLKALIQFCKKEGLDNCYLHLFTDGRDSPPNEGLEIVKSLEEFLKILNIGKIATVSGRYYAMDRDRRWDRTEKAYNAMVLGEGNVASDAISAIENSYKVGKTDEFVEPVVIKKQSGEAVGIINDNDAVVFSNFRIDRPKQLSMVFTIPDFENLKKYDFGYDPEASREVGSVELQNTFTRKKILKNLFFVTMTEYQKNLPVSEVVFAPEMVAKPLGEVISENGRTQLHMAESEKERFVKYYFNGMREEPLNGETDQIVSSAKVATYDKKPQMSLPKLTSEFNKQINKGIYDFAVINFANPDMVAHSGNFKATLTAIEFTDKFLFKLVSRVWKMGGVVLVTADHGNAEELITYPSSTFFITSHEGIVNTDHSNNPVPLMILGKGFEKTSGKVLESGALSDIAPTILGLMKMQVPPEMTGRNLLV